ncbi:putative transporter [Zancudomyces culisetae]|uniref:Putative transporter n=1 Tax=Zancudomyces culisetae TaxID=1213189 RepID=A0A1R1PHF0_ZANCU|nr:putative transporter [Zancudomyces culisetae]|eukprot:OMH80404.1 putative transporter [Zancudomyces culisetae]
MVDKEKGPSNDNYPSEKDDNVNRNFVLTENEQSILKKALRKIDFRVFPIMYLLYLAGAMDRGNVGAALINGMRTSLKLTSVDEGSLNSMFFITYVSMEPFSNILLKRLRPSIWFPFLGISWSITCMCIAAAQNAVQAILIRVLLGAFEAGFTPGLITYMGYWYTREELGPRMSIMFSALPASGIMNLLYGAIVLIKLGSLKPYQVIFVIAGLLTLIIGIISIFVIKDYPETAKFLTPEEKDVVVKRLVSSQGSAQKAVITLKTIISTILDWKVWAFCIIGTAKNNTIIIIGFIGPTIIKSLGFSSTTSTLLSSGPAIIGTVSTLACAFLISKYPYWIRLLILDLMSVICFTVVAFAKNRDLRLAFVFILGTSMYSSIPISMSWMSVNSGSTQKRAIKSAFYAMVGSTAGIFSPFLFTPSYAPKYTIGFAVAFALYGCSIVLTIILRIHLDRANKYRQNNPKDVSHLSTEEQRDLHDLHPDFRYIL